MLASRIGNSCRDIPLLCENELPDAFRFSPLPDAVVKKVSSEDPLNIFFNQKQPSTSEGLVLPSFVSQSKKEKPQGISSIIKKGQRYFDANDYENAEKSFLKALAIEPKSKNILMALELCCFKKGDFEASLKYSEEVLRKDPWNIGTLCNKAECCMALKLDDKAIDCFNKVLEIEQDYFSPLSFRSLSFRSQLYFKKVGEDKNKLKDLLQRQKAIASESETAFCFEELPDMLRDIDLAKQFHVNVQTTIQNASVLALLQSAQVYSEKGQYKLAMEDLLSVSEHLQDPARKELWTMYTKVLCGMSWSCIEPLEKDKALKILSVILERDPQHIRVRRLRIALCWEKYYEDNKMVEQLRAYGVFIENALKGE